MEISRRELERKQRKDEKIREKQMTAVSVFSDFQTVNIA